MTGLWLIAFAIAQRPSVPWLIALVVVLWRDVMKAARS